MCSNEARILYLPTADVVHEKLRLLDPEFESTNLREQFDFLDCLITLDTKTWRLQLLINSVDSVRMRVSFTPKILST
jgi:hypothetical protein